MNRSNPIPTTLLCVMYATIVTTPVGQPLPRWLLKLLEKYS